jgi:hypothetical protein
MGKQAADQADNYMAGLMDELEEFEEFKTQFLPLLRQDLKQGLSPEAIRDKYASLAQATVVAALANPDPKVRQAAAKDLLDRAEGMARQRIEQTHKLEKLPDDQLDAMILSLSSSEEETQDESNKGSVQH